MITIDEATNSSTRASAEYNDQSKFNASLSTENQQNISWLKNREEARKKDNILFRDDDSFNSIYVKGII